MPKGKYVRTEEVKKKMSISHKGKLCGDNNPSKRIEVRLKISKALKGRKLSEEWKKKISDNARTNPNYGMRGKHFSEEHNIRMKEVHKGKHPMSEETKRKIHLANFGRKASEETKLKLSDSHKGENHPMFGKHHSQESKDKMSSTRIRIIKEGFCPNIFQKGCSSWNKGKEFTKEHKENLKIARKRQICPTKDTLIETKIQSFLKELQIEFLTHQYIHIKHGYQCDIFIPSLNLVIECDGNFFHANPKYYQRDFKVFRKGKTAEQKWETDKIRTEEIIAKGYRIIRLWEDEIKIMTIEDFKDKLKCLK